MKIPGIPGLQPARLAQGKAGAAACPESNDTISVGADRPTPLGQIARMSGTSLAPSSGGEWILAFLNGHPKLTQAEVEKILRSTEAKVSPASAQQSLASRAASDKQAYYDATQGTINYRSEPTPLPGAEELLPGAQALPGKPPQAPVSAFGGPFEWEWNLFPGPGRDGRA